MASIRPHNNKWRAHLFKHGFRKSAVFDTREEAEEWASEAEALLDNKSLSESDIRQALAAWSERGTPAPIIVSDKSLDELGLPSKSEILSSATPVPNTLCGVYFLIEKGEVRYVGQSENVLARIFEHRLTKTFDSVALLSCEKSELMTIEATYIHHFKPKLNKYTPGAAINPDDRRKLMALPLPRLKARPDG